MKRNTWISLLLAFCVALAGAAAAEGRSSDPQETAAPVVPLLDLPAQEGGTLLNFPVEEDQLQTVITPGDEFYLYPEEGGEAVGYADPSVTVNIGRGRIYETDYMYARVKIATPTQLRARLASPASTKQAAPGHDLAKRVQAVIAINGDFCGGTDNLKGALMRQGQKIRMKCDERYDILVIDRAGDFHILPSAKNEDVEPWMEKAANIFTFGPGLVIDGVPQYGLRLGRIASHRPAQRMAICQTGELEYLLITSEGPENAGSVGLTLEQFIDLVSSIPGVQNAYNLDGGSSSTMVFRLEGNNWRKVNALSSKKIRPLKDIIYFVTAWEPDEPVETEAPAETGEPGTEAEAAPEAETAP